MVQQVDRATTRRQWHNLLVLEFPSQRTIYAPSMDLDVLN